MMIGLENGIVRVNDYSESWDSHFALAKDAIQRALLDFNVCIEHIGSTSVKGLCAKPIIDILAGIDEFEDGFKTVHLLEKIGYEFKGEFGIPFRHFFIKGSPRTHHLHMVVKDSNFWKEHLLFRNYLRKNEDDMVRYALLKRELAKKFPTDRDMYLDLKAGLIREIIEKAKKESAI